MNHILTWVIALHTSSLTHVHHQAVVIFLPPTKIGLVGGGSPQDVAVFLEVTRVEYIRYKQVWICWEVADRDVGISGLFQPVLARVVEKKMESRLGRWTKHTKCTVICELQLLRTLILPLTG